MYEDMFKINKSDTGGRNGKLEINGIKLDTPTTIPTRNEFLALNTSPFLSEDDIEQFKIGVQVEWFSNDDITKLKKGGVYNPTKYYISRKFKEIPTNIKLLHFEFEKDVKNIDKTSLELLLQIQKDVGVNSIEVPNIYAKWNYKNAIKIANDWRKNTKIDKPLMGLVNNDWDVETIKNNIDSVDAIGLNLRRFSPPLLFNIKNEFKESKKEKWINAFTTPRTYKEFNYNGTAGILINYFGIDTLSYYVAHPMAIRNYILQLEKLSEEEKAEKATETKYFNSTDYSYPNYSVLEKKYGADYHLSELCDCKICKKNTLEGIQADYDYTYFNTRSHDVLKHKDETINFQKSITKEESNKYIDSKQYAKEFIKGKSK